MTISLDYRVVEQIATLARANVASGVRVFDSLPTILNDRDFDQMLLSTVENARLPYFWVIGYDSLDPSAWATQAQREVMTVNLYGYMIRSDRPGVLNSDPTYSAAFEDGTATGGTTATLEDTGAAMTVNAYADTHELWVTFGDGTIDHRRIASNTATVISTRLPFAQAVTSACTYQVYLRPTEWIMHEQARAMVDTFTAQRSLGGRVVTGNTPGYRIEPVTLYERGMWRVTIQITRDNIVSKNWV